jgi:four helix bundle protein
MSDRPLRARTRTLAIAIVRLLDSLPRTSAGEIVRGQLGRSGTSVAANYRRACLAQSRRDFIAKLKVVEEEVDETELWLDLLQETGMGDQVEVARLRRESQEIRAMTTASLRTSRESGHSGDCDPRLCWPLQFLAPLA